MHPFFKAKKEWTKKMKYVHRRYLARRAAAQAIGRVIKKM
jgi:Rad3-related DNA helicase